MIPHIEIPALGPLKPFGMLVAAGILVGNWFALRRAKQAQIDVNDVRTAVAWAVVVGFVGAHLVALVYYKPERIAAEGVLSLLRVWDGISSFGGFLGALVGLLVYFGKRSRPGLLQAAVLATPWFGAWLVGSNALAGQIVFSLALVGIAVYYWKPDRPWSGVAEIIVQALVVGWVFGRMGCSVAFDHPGNVSDFFLAEVYREGESRHNLGFYEMLYTLLVLLPTQLLLFRRNPPKGVIMATICTLYAVVRFFLDYLRATDLATSDVRLLGLTPAQYAALAVVGFGLWQINRVRIQAKDPAYPHVLDLRADYAGDAAPQLAGSASDGKPTSGDSQARRERKRAAGRR